MPANPERFEHLCVAAAVAPPPPADYNRWAEANLEFGPESPFPGRYDARRLPFYRRPLEVLQPDHPARVVALRGSAQVGKTVVAEIFTGASLDLDPGPFLYVHPTEDNAVRWARTKWRPRLRQTPRLGAIFDQKQSKEGGNSTLYQERRDGRGFLLISGASSEASLSMISVPRQVQDDLAKWADNAAGDPEYQAENRSKAFDLAKILKLSTPLLAGSCRITRAFLAGTQEHWHVPCPHCGHEHPLEPENFLATLDAERPETAGFHCPECGGLIEEKHRADIIARGHWVAHNPKAADPSFTIWAAYAPFESWERIARAWLAAQGDPKAEQTWWNDTAGRAYELPGEAPDWADLKARAEASARPRGVAPPDHPLLTLSFDCQDDFIDGVLVAWGPNLTRAVVERLRVEGHISEPEARDELNRLVEFAWPFTDGLRRRADLVGIDANAWTDEVFDWARRWPKSRVLMLRGVGGDTAPALAIVRKERRRDGQLVKYQGRFFNIGVSSLKGQLYKFLRVTEPGARGYIDFPQGLEDDYFEQLTAEKRTPRVDRRGFTVYEWVKPRGLRNEMLDCMTMAEALATKLGWRLMTPEGWSRLAAERAALGAHPDSAAPGTPARQLGLFAPGRPGPLTNGGGSPPSSPVPPPPPRVLPFGSNGRFA